MMSNFHLSTYLLINAAIIVLPLCLSFIPPFYFYKKWRQVFLAIFMVATLFIVWDIWATASGHWSFNTEHVSENHFINLPIEEVLFFITVPYSCLFLYSCLEFYWGKQKIKLSRWWWLGISLATMIGSIVFWNREYTAFVMFLTSLSFFALWAQRVKEVAKSQVVYMMIGFDLFLIFNYLLTSIPVVEYNPEAITGWRVLTIPMEDFFYNWLLLSSSIFFLSISRRLLENQHE